MKAVILAAGLGTRMQSSTPKPLLNLFGMPILEHTLRKLRGYEIIVVYHLKEIADFIKKKFPEVKLIYNPHPEKENGYSLYLAKKHVEDDFILLMADHYYSDDFFNNLNDMKKFKRTTIFVSENCYNPEEATKVKVSDGDVVDIGKKIKDYNYFDTGFFYCKKNIFEYVEKLKNKKEKIRLSDVIREAAKKREVGYKVLNAFWIDIDTKEELKYAEKFIRQSLTKTMDGIVSKNINRKISTRITKFLVKYDFITPNVVTIISTLIGLLSFLSFFKNPALGGILAQLSSIIDGCDGEIARIKNMKSKFGGVLDSLLDRYVDVLIVFAIFLVYGFTYLSAFAFLLAVTGSVFISYLWHLTNVRAVFATRDVRLFIVMVGGILALFSKEFLLYTLFTIGIIAHVEAWLIMFKFAKMQNYGKTGG